MISDSWALLADAPLFGARLRARPVAASDDGGLLLAVDSVGTRHFLIPLASDEAELNDRRGKGLRVETRELQSPDRDNSRYLDIACLEPAGNAVFDAFGEELLNALRAKPDSVVGAVATTLERWRRFWHLGTQAELSRDAEIGLFGELWFLYFWLIPKLGSQAALETWRGPDFARHDFEGREFSVEAKTTAVQRGVVHEISSLDQLAPPDRGPLFLFSLKLAEERGGKNSIHSLLALLGQAMLRDGCSPTVLDSRLARFGLSVNAHAETTRLSFSVRTEGLYRVSDGFPALTRRSFAPPLPDAIDGVSYMLNLGACDEFKVCESPESNDWREMPLA